jgi:hypothetical protein
MKLYKKLSKECSSCMVAGPFNLMLRACNATMISSTIIVVQTRTDTIVLQKQRGDWDWTAKFRNDVGMLTSQFMCELPI